MICVISHRRSLHACTEQPQTARDVGPNHWRRKETLGHTGHTYQLPIYIPMATEGPPTLQSGVIPAWNYVPQLPGKVTPTSSPIVNAARK